MNPNGVEIVRVYTRETGGTVADITPLVPSTGGSFQVVVEAEAGKTEKGTAAPYEIRIEAFDFTSGLKPNPTVPGLGNWTQTSTMLTPPGVKAFNIVDWPTQDHQEIFTIQLAQADAKAVQGHLLKYYAYLMTPPPDKGTPQIVSIAESPLFIVTNEF